MSLFQTSVRFFRVFENCTFSLNDAAHSHLTHNPGAKVMVFMTNWPSSGIRFCGGKVSLWVMELYFACLFVF